MVIKTAAAVLLASALWTPLAAHSVVAASSTDDTITIEVEVPPRTGGPTPSPSPTASPSATPSVTPTLPPSPTPSATPTPSASASTSATPSSPPAPDAERPGSSALPATGAQIALWGLGLAVVAIVVGVAMRMRARRSG